MDLRWWLLCVLLIILLQTFVYSRWALAGVRYQRYFSNERIQAGQTVEMVEVVENDKFLPVPWMVLESTFDAGMRFPYQDEETQSRSEQFLNRRSYFSLPPRIRITRRHTIRCDTRGIYELNTAGMTVGDVFGLALRYKPWTINGPYTRLVVYPRFAPRAALEDAMHQLQGEVEVRRWLLPDPFLRVGARPYQVGDALHSVNWSATARSGELYVHQLGFTGDARLKILLNFEVTEDMWQQVTQPQRIEAGLSMTAALVSEMMDKGMAVGFASNGLTYDEEPMVDIEPQRGSIQLEALLETLAGMRMQVMTSFKDLLHAELAKDTPRTDYLIISGFREDTLANEVQALRAAGHSVTQIRLPDDEEASMWLGVEA